MLFGDDATIRPVFECQLFERSASWRIVGAALRIGKSDQDGCHAIAEMIVFDL
jgi:hypothetical protein